MSFISTSLLSISLSADAFAVSVGRGAALKGIRLTRALRTGAVFGLTEGTMPLIGWAAGHAASQFIQTIDHWIAFVILACVGLKMIKDGWCGEACCVALEEESKTPPAALTFHALVLLVLTAIGTSIDSLAVGVSLAFMDANIWLSAAAIGFSSFSFSTLGLMLGQYIGCKAGSRAEILGGLGLIAIGLKILLQHLGFLPL